MLSVTTDSVIVYRKDGTSKNGKPYSLYSLSLSKKEADGWKNGYMPCSFKKGVEVFNKAKIKIDKAFISFDEYNGNKTPKVVITEFTVIEEGEKPQDDDGFMNIPDSELPFH